jgi:hypothetical protein
MASIYVVDITNAEHETMVRAVVVAASASDASEPYERDGVTVTVGRMGTYEPGLQGAAMYAECGDELVIGPAPR